MRPIYNVLIMGGSYGSLLGIKLALGGHRVKLVCLPDEVRLFNSEGATVRFPIKARNELVEINSRGLPGEVTAAGPGDVVAADYDLVGLAMQEPQYGVQAVRELLNSVAVARVPCISIMNMPPLPYLRRIESVDASAYGGCYTEPAVWDGFDPRLMTLCSPDPQAFRPSPEKLNLLQVRLPTNFKVARFDSINHTEVLRQLQADIEAARYDTGDGLIEIPVKLKVHDSLFVPLAKWCMLLAGNYRCVESNGIRTIKDAIHSNLQESRSVYQWVATLCMSLGAREEDLVPSDKYADAALSLTSPSSVARSLFAGAHHVERVDRLVKEIAAKKNMRLAAVDEIVALVDRRLEANRSSASLSR